MENRKACGLPNKVSIATINALKDDKVAYMTQSPFKRFFKLSFVLIWKKVPSPHKRYVIDSVIFLQIFRHNHLIPIETNN